MPEDKTKRTLDADAFEREVTTDLDEETPDKPKGMALHTRILIGLAVGVIAGLAVGATANQNGTALYEGVTVLFLAQLAGVDLSLGQQLMVVYLAILGGIGTAGVPSGSIPFIIGVLVTIGVNPALIAIILGVDRILDMCRTTLNVVGDITAATFVARSEGYELLKPHDPAIVHAGVALPE
ncbi:MAG TPA: cation:dicarboxylase symporter family transporter [Pyrinomonadaceae bacterium]|jgi:Na+/H+-dicarboxylate symporter|nr:cation:dicarboxylase symporter family transporter [Pyrinomonadaceae bacterium]